MAIGRQSSGKEPITGQDGPISGARVPAIAGQAGRMQVPPEGDIYVRDPAAARAQAIRDKVAQFRRQGLKVPEHLQAMFDALPANDGSVVELVDAVTGKHKADVEVDGGEPPPPDVGSSTNIYPKRKEEAKEEAEEELAIEATAKEEEATEDHVEHVHVVPGEVALSSSGDLRVEVVAQETGEVLGTVSARVPEPAPKAVEPPVKPAAPEPAKPEPSTVFTKPAPPAARHGRPAKKVSAPKR